MPVPVACTEKDRQSASKVLAIVQLMMLTENYSKAFLNSSTNNNIFPCNEQFGQIGFMK